MPQISSQLGLWSGFCCSNPPSQKAMQSPPVDVASETIKRFNIVFQNGGAYGIIGIDKEFVLST